jgi:hypothetical protein
MIKIVICGDRNWKSAELSGLIETWLLHVLQQYDFAAESVTILTGGCRGVNQTAKEVALYLGMQVQTFSAQWKKYGKAAGPIRNAEMIAQEPVLVLGFHRHIENSKGTANCLKQAQEAGIRNILISH